MSMRSAAPGLWMGVALAAAAFSFGSHDKAEATLASALAVCCVLAALRSLGQRDQGSAEGLRDLE